MPTNNDPKFLNWLHRLTLIGYDDDIFLSVQDLKKVEALYLDGATPEFALEQFKTDLREDDPPEKGDSDEDLENDAFNREAGYES